MSASSEAAPRYRTGVIWVVLTVLLGLGSVACAFFAYGFIGFIGNGPAFADLALMIVAALAALYLLLLVAGILYRIDRLRGTPHRRIDLFE